jgi:Tfp pilus assembly protein PilN
MKTVINLASQPFRRDRPMIVASWALGSVMVGLLGILVWLIYAERTESAGTRAEIARLQRGLAHLAQEQAAVDASLRRPENAQVLERSLFLNAVLHRKGISWTRLFEDLEKTVPYNVRVIAIRPWIDGRNQVKLEMTVGAEQTEPLLKLLIDLEQSKLFGETAVTSRQPPSQNEPLFRYKLQVNYAQQL